MNATYLFSVFAIVLAMFTNTAIATEVPGGIAAKNAKGDFVYYDFASKQSTILVDAATLGNATEYAASDDARSIFFVKDNQLIVKSAYENKFKVAKQNDLKTMFWPVGGISNLAVSPRARMFFFETKMEDSNFVFVDKKSPEGLNILRIGFPRNAFVPAGAPIYLEKTAVCNAIVICSFNQEACSPRTQFGNTAIHPGAIPFISIDKETGKLRATVGLWSGDVNSAYGGMDLSLQDAIQRFAKIRHAVLGCFSPDEEFFAAALKNDDGSFDRIEIRSLSSPNIGVFTNKRGVISSIVMPTVKPGIYEIPLRRTVGIKGLAWTRPANGKPASLTVLRGKKVYLVSGDKIKGCVDNSGIQRGRKIDSPPMPVNNILRVKFELVTSDIDADSITWISDKAFVYRDIASGTFCKWENGEITEVLSLAETQKAFGTKDLPDKYTYCPEPASNVLLAEGTGKPKDFSGTERVQEATNSAGELSIGPFKGIEFVTENNKSARIRTNSFLYCIVEGKVDSDLTNYVCDKRADPEEGLEIMKSWAKLPKDLRQYKYFERQLGWTVIVPLGHTLILQNDVGDRLAIKPVSLETDEAHAQNLKYFRKRHGADAVPEVFEYLKLEWKFQPTKQPIVVAGKPTTTK